MTDRLRLGSAVAVVILMAAAGCSAITDRDQSATTEVATDPSAETTTETSEERSDEPSTTVSPPPGDGDLPPPEPVAWASCGDLECGTVSVPLDYDEPGGDSLEIALTRAPARGQAVGSIFVNPGGPGASGVDFVREGFRLDDETTNRYHIVGFDPRGIGRSNPLSCEVDRAAAPLGDWTPDTPVETETLDREAIDTVAECRSSDGDLLPHLTTANVARDLDRLRQAVGDPVLHYYGLSYGTLLAVHYGQLFPDKVGHLGLDGVVDPEAKLTDLLRQQALAFESQFAQLDRRCGDTACPSDGITATFDRVLNRLEAEGPVGDVGGTELIIASLLPAYSPAAFPAYAAALDLADGGNYTAIENLSDFFVNAISFTAYAAFACADGQPPTGAEAWSAFAAELHELAPRFGAVVANELRVCAFWPPPDDDVVALDLSAVSVPVLVVGNTADAATPLENAQKVASLLTEAHLVVLDDERHTAYNGSSCVRDLVADYFADRLPAGESRCSAD